MNPLEDEIIKYTEFNEFDQVQRYEILSDKRTGIFELVIDKFESNRVEGGLGYKLIEISTTNPTGRCHECSKNYIKLYYTKRRKIDSSQYKILDRCLYQLEYLDIRQKVLTKMKLDYLVL